MSIMQSPPGAETVIDGRSYLYFVGTGYLGLQGHPEVIKAAGEAARQYGTTTYGGYTGSNIHKLTQIAQNRHHARVRGSA